MRVAVVLLTLVICSLTVAEDQREDPQNASKLGKMRVRRQEDCQTDLCALLVKIGDLESRLSASEAMAVRQETTIRALQTKINLSDNEMDALRKEYEDLTAVEARQNATVSELENIPVDTEPDQLEIIYKNLMNEVETSNQNLTDLQETSYKSRRDRLEAKNKNMINQIETRNKNLKDNLQMRLCASDKGYQRFGGSCYYHGIELKFREHSRLECIRRGAHLVVINSAEEQEYIFTMVKSAHHVDWIGLTNKEGTWTWADGTPLTTSYWYREPAEGKDCVGIVAYSVDPVASWVAYGCGEESLRNRFYWVCERDVMIAG